MKDKSSNPITIRRTAVLLNCGFISGLLQAFIFNPWDRALYLSVKHERSFLVMDNFSSPMAGVTQTVVQRAISSGLYFPLEQIAAELLYADTELNAAMKSWKLFAAGTIAGAINGIVMDNFSSPMAGVTQTVVQRAISSGLYFPLEQIAAELLHADTELNAAMKSWKLFAAGTIAGAINGIVMNPFTRIKYHFWGKRESEKPKMASIAKEIYQHGGIRHFFLGSNATVQRDLLFGGTFAVLRHKLLPPLFHKPEEKGKASFTVNVVAGCLATIVSSPLNYVRNVHYATHPSSNPESALAILKKLIADSLKDKTFLQWASFLQSRLRLGWGTARVGCGMAFGAKVYEWLEEKLLS